jgi:hypothetical protein
VFLLKPGLRVSAKKTHVCVTRGSSRTMQGSRRGSKKHPTTHSQAPTASSTHNTKHTEGQASKPNSQNSTDRTVSIQDINTKVPTANSTISQKPTSSPLPCKSQYITVTIALNHRLVHPVCICQFCRALSQAMLVWHCGVCQVVCSSMRLPIV